MNRVVRFATPDGPAALDIRQETIPTPSSGEVCVTIEAAGLNRSEWLYSRGEYLFEPPKDALIGAEATGRVQAVGPDVTGFAVGDAVCILPSFRVDHYGVLAEHALVPATSVIPRPKGLDPIQAAAVWMGFATAYGGLVTYGGLRLGKDQRVLISAAASSIGIPAIQIAKDHGAYVIATTRSADKRAQLLAAGADQVVVTDTDGTLEGAEFDIAFDPVSGPFWHDLVNAAAPGARIISYGSLAYYGTEPSVPLFALITKNVQLIGYYVVWHLFEKPELWGAAYDYLLPRIEEGRFQPLIHYTYPLSDVRDAYLALEGNAPIGKIVVTP
ncbi:MAG: zinc-dependent alcohol dehydrogenase family protein [Pseudomonadota bacterium]